MKILHVIPTLAKGGAERLVTELCKELNARHHEAAIVLLHPRNDFADSLHHTTVHVCESDYRYRLFGRSSGHFSSFRQLAAQFQPHLIHTHLFEAEFVTRQFLIPGVAYVSHLHDNMPQFKRTTLNGFTSKKGIAAFFERRHILSNYRRCHNHFIANSRHTRDYFMNNLPADLRDRLTYLPNAIALQDFPMPARPFPQETLKLVNTGSMVAKKNQTLLLKSVYLLRRQGMDVRLTLLGDGTLRATLEIESRQLGIDSVVTFAGNVNDVTPHLAAAHLYVHAATYEPFGLSILEAMATGLPVVCLAGGGNEELVSDGVEGMVVRQNDADRFAAAIKGVVRSEADYRQYAQAAQQRAAQYDMGNYVDQLLQLYQNMQAS